MVDAVARAVVFTLRTSRPPVGHKINLASSSRRAMEHSFRSFVRTDFFTPHPRQVKGKEKAREIQEYECSHCARHHFLSRGQLSSKLKPSFRRQECDAVHTPRNTVPNRPRVLRKHPSHHLPHPIRRNVPSNNLQKRLVSLGQRRHVSNLSDPPSSSSSAAQPNPKTAKQEFSLFLDTAEDNSFDIEAAWTLYDAVKKTSSLTYRELLSFADKILTRAEQEYNSSIPLETLHHWGHRVQGVLESIEPEIPPRSTFDFQRRCLMARAAALAGDQEGATPVALQFAHFFAEGGEEKQKAGVQVYNGILMSLCRHFDPTRALDFLMAHWKTIGVFTVYRSKNTIISIVARIERPVDLLTSRGDWDELTRGRVGTLLINVLCLLRLSKDALGIYEEMLRQGLHVSLKTHRKLISGLVRDDAFEHANTLFSTLRKTDDKFYRSIALQLFSHQGVIERAEHFFSLIERRGEVNGSSIALLLHAYALNGKTEDVVRLFNQFYPKQVPNGPEVPSPTIGHYTIITHAHAIRNDLDGVNHWLRVMSDAGIPPDMHVYTVVLRAFADRGEIDSVGTVLDQMSKAGIPPGVVAYTIVISLLADRQDPVAAEAIFKRAIKEGVTPDRRMITAVMNAHVEAGSWQGVIRVFDYLSSNPSPHLQLTIEVYNTLLKAYVLIGAPFQIVSNIFRKLESVDVQPDVRTFALLIQSACDSGMMTVASEIFLEMERRSGSWELNLDINAYVLTIIMSGFLRLGMKDRARGVYEDMQRRGIQPTAVTHGSIMRAYAREGSPESVEIAENFLRSLMEENPDDKSWATLFGGRRPALEFVYAPLMAAYARQERPEEVERLYKSMLDRESEPSLGVMTVLLDAYRRTKKVDSVLQLWTQIHQQALRQSTVDALFLKEEDNNPAVEQAKRQVRRQGNLLCVPLSICTDALSAAGLHDDIAQIWRTLQVQGFAFDSHNWNHLAVALIRAGEPERAFEIVEKVILFYRRQSQSFISTRDKTPESPLTFDDEPMHPDAPASSDPLHRPRRRVETVRMMRGRLGWKETLEGGNEDMRDFAHPLHILHQISPAWNIWRPHSAVTRLLIMVMRHLESGMTVDPVQPGDPRAFKLVRDTEKRREMAGVAAEMLDRIHKNYPKALAYVQHREQLLRSRGKGIFFK